MSDQTTDEKLDEIIKILNNMSAMIARMGLIVARLNQLVWVIVIIYVIFAAIRLLLG
jgi:hypothetical protein